VKILLEHLRRHVDLPESARECRELLDDLGIEVKNVETTDLGHVFNVELLANRGDHYCYSGIAREVSGRTGSPLTYQQSRALDVSPASPDRVRVETPLCLVYTLTELTAPAQPTGSLPSNILAPMLAADMHSTLAPVDASNVTNLDIGQPTHAFDAETISGAVTIRTSRPGERAWLLFTPEPVDLPEGTLVIADDAKILGIAGVIGCVESAVTDRTRRILLESACFDPAAVRLASRQLNQPTDAAARFMRGGDPSLPLIGAARVAWLLETNCGYVVGEVFEAGEWRDPRRTIEIDVPATKRFIGADISAPEMVDRLTRYGFAVYAGGSSSDQRSGFYDDTQSLSVIVPPHRLWDVEFASDIAEELLKSVGYNATEVTLPHVTMGALPSHWEKVHARVSEVLVAEGFYEIFTDSFYSRRMRERLAVSEDNVLWQHVETQNSIEKDYSLLRNNTVAQALDALATNVDVRNANVKMFEWARVFLADPAADNGVCREEEILWALANGRDRGPFWGDKGRPADAVYLKGILQQIRYELRVDLRTGAATGHRLERLFHPGRCAGIHLGDAEVGIFGEIHPSLLQRFDIKRQRPVYFEIRTAALFSSALQRTFIEPPSRQPIIRNVAYAIPAGITAADVSDVLAAAAPPFLREIRVVDLYEMPDDPHRARAITYEIEYLPDEALTGEAINAATEEMIAAVASQFGDRVSLRV
jgi:phenylalanyl-tRNA synthetase beta chain